MKTQSSKATFPVVTQLHHPVAVKAMYTNHRQTMFTCLQGHLGNGEKNWERYKALLTLLKHPEVE